MSGEAAVKHPARDPFRPSALLAGGHVQSVLASLPLRRPMVERRARRLIAASSDLLLDGGDGVRLHARHTPALAGDARALALLIHGWEGSSDSLYMLSLGAHLAEAGYEVLRLNLRDHGPSHHLNPGLFHSNRIREVVGAVADVQRRFPRLPLLLGGYSLGGNFAIRVSVRAREAGLDIRRTVAVCPVLDPAHTLDALENGWFGYRRYFIAKWRRSLLVKAACFPDLYDFSELARFTSLTAMTEHFVRHYSGFPDMTSYLDGYAITGDKLAGLEVPTHILFAEDDPVIPVADLDRLARTPSLTVTRTARGGHCGFMENLRMESWANRQIERIFAAAVS